MAQQPMSTKRKKVSQQFQVCDILHIFTYMAEENIPLFLN